MRYISVASLAIFYIFFFSRAVILRKELGKSIKAKDPLLDASILFAGLSSLLFVLQKTTVSFDKYLFIFPHSPVFEIIGTVLIILGLITSSIASLGLGSSWRVGIDRGEKTSLITGGIYSLSRNPYFLSYDLVLFGLILSTFSLFIALFSLTTVALFHCLILKEEKYLETMHGEEYLGYKKRVRRYI